jgi:hypothetical protein
MYSLLPLLLYIFYTGLGPIESAARSARSIRPASDWAAQVILACGAGRAIAPLPAPC